MPTSKPTGPPVTVEVPSVCADRFRIEARSHLAMAAENVAEGATWERRHQDHVRLDGADRPRYHEADRVWEQVREFKPDEPMKVTAPRSAVATLLRAAVQGVADDIREETNDEWSPRSLLALTEELTAWATLFRDSRLPTAPGARRAS